jgi:hypothetical protein
VSIRVFSFGNATALVRALLIASVLSIVVYPVDVPGQAIPPIVIEEPRQVQQSDEMSRTHEETIRDLVERYEDMRERLREALRRNEDLYSRAELDDAVRDLEAKLQRAEERSRVLEARLKDITARQRIAEERARRYKILLVKGEAELRGDLEAARWVSRTVQAENLFQVGSTFSPAGTMGLVGIINLPGSRLSLLGGADYHLRSQEWMGVFGFTLGFLSQRTIVDALARTGSARESKRVLTPEELRATRPPPR